MKKLTLFLLLITSFCFAQRKETISGTFFDFYYPNGEHLFNNSSTHTIPSHRGHIEVTLPPEVLMMVYQTQIDGSTRVVFNNQFSDRSIATKYFIGGPYGGPNFKIDLTYPIAVNQTIVYNIDFYYYDTLYGPDVEPNDTMETAIPMSENTSYEGWGQCYETLNQNFYDYYKVTAAKRGIYTITALINNTLGNGHMTSLSHIGDKFHYNNYETEAGTKSTLKVYCVDKGDEFYVFTESGLNSYKLNYTIEESIDENDMEPNNTFDEATEISENTKMNGTIGYGGISAGPLPKDSEDYYKIVPSKNGKLIISFKEKIEVPENFINFYLKDTNGRLSGLDTKALTVNNQTFEIDCASPDKTYYAQLIMSKLFASNYPCCNAYEISWNMQDTSNAGCGFLETADFELNKSFSIAPNPATDILQLKVKNNQTINQITIRDITGKTVMSPTSNNNTVDIKKLNSGIYFLQAKINDKSVIQKFIKK